MVALLAGAVACSDAEPRTGTTSDAGTTDAGVTTDGGQQTVGEDFPEKAIDALCTAAMNCDDPNALPFAFPSKAVCAEFFAATMAHSETTFDTPAAIVDSIKAGHITFNEAKADECYTALAAKGCDALGSNGNPLLSIPACREALAGQVAENGACITHVACSGELFCSRADLEDRCEGKCVARGAGRCETDAHCAVGQRCMHGSEGPTCAAPKAADAECSDTSECQDGLYCQWGESSATCQPLPGEGEECEGSCASGLICVVDRNEGSTCLPVPEEDGDPCVDFMCGPGLYCALEEGDEGEVSICRPVLEANEECGGNAPCREGLSCIETAEAEYKCLAAPGLGESCVSDTHCDPFRTLTYCHPTSKTCALLPEAGSPCVTVLRFGWEENLCHPLKAWCEDDGSTRTCRAFKQAGQSCDTDNACGTEVTGGACVDGVCVSTEAVTCEP